MEDIQRIFSLSIRNINQTLKTLSYQTDFTFVFNDHEFHTYKIIADILSPAIAQIHRTDPTYDTFVFKNIDSNIGFFDFNKIICLVDDPKYSISTKEELQMFKEIFFELQNEDVFKILSSLQCQITIKNVFQRIQLKLSMNSNVDISEETEFIAKNFFDICKTDEIKSLPLGIIENILFNDNLVLLNEDELFNFITSYSLEKSILEETSKNNNNDLILQFSQIGVDFDDFNFHLNLSSKVDQDQNLSDVLIDKNIFDNCFVTLLDSVFISNLSDNALSVFLGLYNFHEMTSIVWEKVAMKILNVPVNFQNKQKVRYSCAKSVKEEKNKKYLPPSNFGSGIEFFDPLSQTNSQNDLIDEIFSIPNNRNNNRFEFTNI